MSGYKENIPSDDEHIGGADDVQYVDEEMIKALDEQEDQEPDDQSNDSGFQTFDESSCVGDESFNDGEIQQ